MTNLISDPASNSDPFYTKSGRVVTLSIDHDDVKTISKYRNTTSFRSVKAFVQEVISSSIRWMDRMINGEQLFELESMDYWSFDPSKNRLQFKPSGSALKVAPVAFDMSFTSLNIEGYNQGLASILNGLWYKTYAFPPVVVELIACCDILYRRNHSNVSPAAASKIPHADLRV